MNAVGEIELKLNGRAYTLRPSFKAIERIESETGRGILKIWKEFRDSEYRARDLAIIVQSCIVDTLKRGDREPELDEVGQWLHEAGIATVAREVYSMMVYFLNKPAHTGQPPADAAEGEKKA